MLKKYLLLCLAVSVAVQVSVAQDKANKPSKAQETVAEKRTGYLRSGDVLQVTVYKHAELSMSVRIDPDNTFLYPQCGKINVKGKTPGEVAAILKQRLSEADIPEAEVVVFVKQYSPRYVYLLGEVKRSEGKKVLEVDPGVNMTALQAISSVGGFTDKADLNGVYVRHQRSDGTFEKRDVNVVDLMKQSRDADPVFLQPGDTVVVPAAEPITVLGEVEEPQTLMQQQNTSITAKRAIAMAGGFTEKANKHAVSLMRDGDVKQINVSSLDSTDSSKGKLNDTVLKSGDTLLVKTTRTVAVLGQVNEPQTFPLPENVPVSVTRAIAMAEGFKDIAKRDSVLHFRDGDVTEINVSNILDQNNTKDKDIQLQPGDMVYVPESRW